MEKSILVSCYFRASVPQPGDTTGRQRSPLWPHDIHLPGCSKAKRDLGLYSGCEMNKCHKNVKSSEGNCSHQKSLHWPQHEIGRETRVNKWANKFRQDTLKVLGHKPFYKGEGKFHLLIGELKCTTADAFNALTGRSCRVVAPWMVRHCWSQTALTTMNGTEIMYSQGTNDM